MGILGSEGAGVTLKACTSTVAAARKTSDYAIRLFSVRLRPAFPLSQWYTQVYVTDDSRPTELDRAGTNNTQKKKSKIHCVVDSDRIGSSGGPLSIRSVLFQCCAALRYAGGFITCFSCKRPTSSRVMGSCLRARFRGCRSKLVSACASERA